MKCVEVVNIVLNRFVVGDFLELLGKEFGLEVLEIIWLIGDRVEVKERDGGLGRSKNNDEYRSKLGRNIIIYMFYWISKSV